VTLDTTINQVNANFQVVTELLKSILDTKTVASLKQSADSLQQVTKASQTDKTIRIAVNMGPSGISFTDLATKINRDPSVVIRGTAQRPLGPGEEK
jgi:phospholipid/cholesterol/gamma-HCH transport system substrate-binding protein